MIITTRLLAAKFIFTACLLPHAGVFAQGQSLKTDLVAYWPLDIIQGTKTPDLKNGYDMDLVNLTAADLVPGRKGTCFSFTNSRQTLLKRTNVAGENLPVTNKPSFTVSFWAKIDYQGQNDRRLFSEGNNATNDPLFNLGTANNGGSPSLDIYIRNSGTTLVDHPKTTIQPFDGVDWHHILFVQTLQGVGESTRQVYIDNVLDGITLANRAAGAVYNYNTTSIGGILRAAPAAWVTGLIDEVAVWNRALTEAEIADLFANGIPSLAPPLEPLKINKFESDFPVTVLGNTTRLNWDVTKDATITISPGIGDVTAQSAFGVGKRDVALPATTTYTLTASRGAEVPVTRNLTVTAKQGIAPGWDWLEDYDGRTAGSLTGQGRWITGEGQALIAKTDANASMKFTAGTDLLALPLLSRTLLETKKATLFFRFCLTSEETSLPIDTALGLTEKSIRSSGDFVTNMGTYVHFAREPDGPLTIEARDGIQAGYQASSFTFQPGQVYNVWMDVTNQPLESTDTYSVHVAPEGGARTTLFENLASDREPQEIVVLGSPLPDIHFLFMVARTAAQASEALLFDDFYVSTANVFNTTVPIPSAFGKNPPGPFAITAFVYQKATGSATLTWSSRAAETYSIWTSFNLINWSVAASGINSGGASTSHVLPGPFSGPLRYFQIRR